MNSLSARLASAASVLALGMAIGSAAQAQSQPTPPEHYTLDPRGVDLVNLDFTLSTTDVVIGQPGQGGLAYGRTYLSSGEGWRDSNAGTFLYSGNDLIVSFGPLSERFVFNGSTWVPAEDNGSTFEFGISQAIVTNAAGVRVVFDFTYDGMETPYGNATPLVATVTFPNGEQLTYHNLAKCDWGGTYPCLTIGGYTGARLQSITSNRGYQLKFVYQSDDIANLQEWLRTKQVIGLNNAIDYCDPLADVCGSLTRTWPSMTYSNQDNPLTATDQSNRTVTYTYDSSGRMATVRLPGSTSDDLDIDYDSAGKVTQVVGASGTWTYAYSDSGAERTTVTDGPLGQESTVVSDLTIGRAVRVTDALQNEWEYAYTDGSLTEVEAPENNRTEYTYDARGNVTRVRNYDKGGSSYIETSATYPSSCTGNVACNSPLTTTDAMGRVTNYSWDATHGGLLSVTLPAPATGEPRPETRYTYAAQTAYYKDSSGTIVAAPSTVTLPTQVSACATGTSCAGTADEVRTTITYGATGVANNLLPTQTASGSGSSPSMAVTAMTYTANGDVETVDGPLSGTADLTQVRYDDARQTVGVVGPDPDGTGSLKNRATRMTYNTRGQVTLAEQGTTPGYTNSDWAAFVTLQKSVQGYGAFGRPIRAELQAANGTIYGLSQVSYDAAGRPECQAVRMNPAVFSTVTADACALGTQAGFGPDRILRTTYDPLSRPSSTTSGYGVTGEAITESVTYSSNGMPEMLTDGDGNVSIIEYDGFDRAKKLRYPNATGGGTSTTDYDEYTYDNATNITSAYRRGVTVGMTYDGLNRLTEVTAPSVPTRGYEYDNLGRLTIASNAGQPWQWYGWDALGRMTSEQWSAFGTVSSQYDAAGRRTRLTWPGSFYVDYEFDVYGAMTAVRENGATTGAGVLATYAYDDLGRRTSMTRGNGANTTYAWDAVSRLATLAFDPAGTGQDQSYTYAYDPAGGIVSRTLSNSAYLYAPATGSTSYANDGLNRVTSAGGTGVTYDARGNVLTAPGRPSLTYSGLNQLATAGSTGLYYEPLGRLYQTSGGTAPYVRRIYSGQQMIAEFDGAGGSLARRHVPGAGLDEVVATVEASGTRSWLQADERGSVVALVDAAGTAGQINAYDEYGVPASGNAGTFQYTGLEWLGFAGLQHSRARMYDPTLGRFLQTDPIGYAAGPNLYAYVGGDPVNLSDPSGLMPCVDIYVVSTFTLWSNFTTSRDVAIQRRPSSSYCAARVDPTNMFEISRPSEYTGQGGPSVSFTPVPRLGRCSATHRRVLRDQGYRRTARDAWSRSRVGVGPRRARLEHGFYSYVGAGGNLRQGWFGAGTAYDSMQNAPNREAGRELAIFTHTHTMLISEGWDESPSGDDRSFIARQDRYGPTTGIVLSAYGAWCYG